jgi:hypothetical protein
MQILCCGSVLKIVFEVLLILIKGTGYLNSTGISVCRVKQALLGWTGNLILNVICLYLLN